MDRREEILTRRRLAALLLIAIAMLAGRAAAGQDVVILRSGESRSGRLQSCVGDRCTLEGQAVARAEIRWIGFQAAGGPPAVTTAAATDAVFFKDGTVREVEVLGISLGAIATRQGSFDRGEVAWVRFKGETEPADPERTQPAEEVPESPEPEIFVEPPPPPPDPEQEPPSPEDQTGSPPPPRGNCGFWMGLATFDQTETHPANHHQGRIAIRLREAPRSRWIDWGELTGIPLDSVRSEGIQSTSGDHGSVGICSGRENLTIDEADTGMLYRNTGRREQTLDSGVEGAAPIRLPPGATAYTISLSWRVIREMTCTSGASVHPSGANNISFPRPHGRLEGKGRMDGSQTYAPPGLLERVTWQLSRVEAPCNAPPPHAELEGPPPSLGDVFEEDLAGITPQAAAELQKLIEYLRASGSDVKITILIKGGGDPLFLEALAKARYQAIKTWLEEHGIDGSRIADGGYRTDAPGNNVLLDYP